MGWALDLVWAGLQTHSSAEEAAARAALVLDHPAAVVLTQNQQLNGVGRTHHLVFEDSDLAARQLTIHTLRGHALPVGQGEDLSTLGRLHAAAAQW